MASSSASSVRRNERGRPAGYLRCGLRFVAAVNKLKPGSVKNFKKSKMPFVCMENIAAYTTACKGLGLPDNYNFVTVDLWDASNIKQVALNVVSLKRQLGFGFDKGAGPQVWQRRAASVRPCACVVYPRFSVCSVGCRRRRR